jgi:hypothetical protein
MGAQGGIYRDMQEVTISVLSIIFSSENNEFFKMMMLMKILVIFSKGFLIHCELA